MWINLYFMNFEYLWKIVQAAMSRAAIKLFINNNKKYWEFIAQLSICFTDSLFLLPCFTVIGANVLGTDEAGKLGTV